MDLGIAGRVALVTGGSKGIGRACAAVLAAEGCRVAVAARGREGLEATARELSARGTETLVVAADLADAAEPARVVAAVVERFGELDILVNNAGAIRGGAFLDTPAAQWADDWGLKVLGYVRLAQAAIPVMRRRRWGRIVNVIGAAARNPAVSYMAGGIANAGLVNFTRALADLAAPDGILVNAVSPGPTATERWETLAAQQARAQGRAAEAFRADVERAQPLGRIGRPEDVAAVVAFLASERAGFVTGACVTVDGGASRGVYL
jgi:NAD(P)-dependent dehydrogenase (short-subunit alcohol dehydrogenase family)